MQNYSSPAYPSHETKPAATLKKLPVRWAKNAAILACIGALSLGALTGCGAQAPVQSGAPCDDGLHGISVAHSQGISAWYAENWGEFDVEVRAHWGGSGAGPFYVAYLTEQEALGIIRNRLCEAGICFDSPLPDYVATAETPWSGEATATLSLFDERTRQGIVFPELWLDEFRWGMSREEVEDALRQDFARRFNVSATFMENPGESMCDGDWWANQEVEMTFTNEEKQEAGQILHKRLLLQIDAFLDHLRAEGILPADEGG